MREICRVDNNGGTWKLWKDGREIKTRKGSERGNWTETDMKMKPKRMTKIVIKWETERKILRK